MRIELFRSGSDTDREGFQQADSQSGKTGVARLGSGSPAEELAKIDVDQVGCVVADFVLWHPKWEPQHFEQLSEILRPQGRVVFLEPVATYGWRRRLHRRMQARFRRDLRYDFEKDVPADLRRSGLILTTVDRFDLARTQSYAWGQAQHF